MRTYFAFMACFAAAILSSCAGTPAKHAVQPAAATTPAAVPELAATSISDLEHMVAAGNLRANVELGTRYGLGQGVKVDFVKAIDLMRAAAERGEPQAQFFLGTAYYNGAGVPKDETSAALWFERSAAQHYPVASYWMGFMLAFGKGGLSPTWAGAVPYLWDAATQDGFAAAALLGYAYDKGTDVPHNPRAAAYWYRRADWLRRTQQNDFDYPSLFNLRVLIEHGEVAWQPGDPGEAPQPKTTPSP